MNRDIRLIRLIRLSLSLVPKHRTPDIRAVKSVLNSASSLCCRFGWCCSRIRCSVGAASSYRIRALRHLGDARWSPSMAVVAAAFARLLAETNRPSVDVEENAGQDDEGGDQNACDDARCGVGAPIVVTLA